MINVPAEAEKNIRNAASIRTFVTTGTKETIDVHRNRPNRFFRECVDLRNRVLIKTHHRLEDPEDAYLYRWQLRTCPALLFAVPMYLLKRLFRPYRLRISA